MFLCESYKIHLNIPKGMAKAIHKKLKTDNEQKLSFNEQNLSFFCIFYEFLCIAMKIHLK